MSVGYLKQIKLQCPGTIHFGEDSFSKFITDFEKAGRKRLFVLIVPELFNSLKTTLFQLEKKNFAVLLNAEIKAEPSFSDLEKIVKQVHDFNADAIVGIGGGSVLDTAKLLAVSVDKTIAIQDLITGKSEIKRSTYLACLPTTAGTGSEVSPNAIFYHPENGNKTAIIHPSLIPDAVYVDPKLMVGVPPFVTAFTGIDALTHCIEAFVNQFAHPIIDLYALEGIALIGQNLKKAFEDGTDLDARAKVALGSMYGGMCLGPVNTAAVHALAYPLGSKYKIAHGVSNAMLLPQVLQFNLKEAPGKYAKVARALGVSGNLDDLETAKQGIDFIQQMITDFNIPQKLSDFHISEREIPELANDALKIERLLKDNVRKVSLKDAIEMYKKLV